MPSSPNLLILLVDQMRMQAMEFWNTPGFELRTVADPVKTPNLNALARESVVLSNALCNTPICSPYRGMLMSGIYSPRNGVPNNCNSNSAPYGCELPADTRCWSDVLKDKGYSLGYIGKWHLDAPRDPYVDTYNNEGHTKWNEWCPPERRHGFDFWHSYGTFDRHMNPEYWTTDAPRDERTKVNQWGPEHEADLAIRYLQNEDSTFRSESDPFVLVVSMNPPHTPYDLVPERYVELYEGVDYHDLLNRPNVDIEGDGEASVDARKSIKDYLAMVTGIDDQIGRILSALDEQGLRDDTVVLFTSDHGNCVGCHDNKHKSVFYEESLLVPFMMRWPGRLPARHEDKLILNAPDLYPTLLDLMGFAGDVPAAVEGRSRASVLRGQGGDYPRSGPYFLAPTGQIDSGRRGVRTLTHTLGLIQSSDDEMSTLLFDNVADPYQMENVADSQPDVVRDLIENELIPWLEYTGDPWLRHLRAEASSS